MNDREPAVFKSEDSKRRYAVLAGEQNGSHKLTAEEVKRLRKEVGVSISDLSREYGVSRRQVRRILTGDSWRSGTRVGLVATYDKDGGAICP